MTQAWVVMRFEYDRTEPLAVFASYEEADAFGRAYPAGHLVSVLGPVPVGLHAMAAIPNV